MEKQKNQNEQNMPALYNEKLFLRQLVEKYTPNIEKASPEVVIDNLEVSVDFIWKEKGLSILFEIDSYNSAMNIFGEYVLLNQVKDYEANCILVSFIVIKIIIRKEQTNI